MTILSSDIRLLESERMTDTPDGGGRRTSRVVPDGVAGNVFPKISRVDSVYGRINLRKIYGHVNTANVDMYAGAHVIITDAPDNPRIGVLVFASGGDYDTRTDARNFVENYVVAGPESRMLVYGRQLKNAGVVLAYQRPEEPLPDVGDVYCLSEEAGDVLIAQQFFAVQKIAHELRTFVDNAGEFTYRVLTLTTTTPLGREFRGLDSPSRFSDARGATLLRATTVADAARYFGIKPLSAAADLGALTLHVPSVYAPIVPTTQREVPVSLASIGGAAARVATAGAPVTDAPVAVPFPYDFPFVLRTAMPIYPGSLILELNVGGGGWGSHDDGNGNVLRDAGGAGFAGTVDYETGTLHLTPEFFGGVEITPSYLPAAQVSQAAHTATTPITLATRGTVYTGVMLPLPAPGTAALSFRALGRWYTLRDVGDGTMAGTDAAQGTGTVDYASGAYTVTLGALPDVGSSLVRSWGSPVHYEVRTADAAGPYQEFLLDHLPAKPGTVVPSYTADGTTYTLADDGVGGLSGGGATGTINYFTGQGRITYSARLPDFDSTLSIAYTQSVIDPDQSAGTTTADATLRKVVTVAPTSATSLALGMAVVPGTPRGGVSCVAPDGTEMYVGLQCNNDGSVSIEQGTYGSGGASGYFQLPQAARGTVVGSIDNVTGIITLSGSADFTAMVWGVGSWAATTTASVPIRFKTGITATFWLTPGKTLLNATGGGTVEVDTSGLVTIDTAQTLTALVESAAPVRVDLTATSSSKVVAGSVLFTLAGKTFFERSGTLYCDLLQSGSATPAGSIDYASGIATPSLWVRGAAPGLAIQSCLVKFGDFTATSAYFRTAGSPLRPASTYVQVTAEDGTLITATADLSGNIVGALVLGTAEQSMGVVALRFGEYVTAAGNEREPWYDPAEVVGADVWKPRAVQPQTLRYSTVVISNVPLSSALLGLDPVRLPSDGRVPIYRPADINVLHHTGSFDAGTPAAGSTIDVGRTDLAALWLEDADRKKLPATLYSADLATGIATMAADAVLTGYATPIAARHRIEQMLLITDVQINGEISIAAPLVRDFPADSQLSGALPFGDVFARVESLFDQQTWTGEWSDTRIGDQAAAQYNDIDYPIEVLNDGAVNERWRINFTSSTAFQVIGENLGVIGTGSTAADVSISNLLTGKPYFVLRKDGWGTGWPVGVQLRFNTVAAAPGFQIARVILPGATLEGDSFDLAFRGDAD